MELYLADLGNYLAEEKRGVQRFFIYHPCPPAGKSNEVVQKSTKVKNFTKSVQ
jgi:hypothetical protein